jgi:hypothetical protein
VNAPKSDLLDHLDAAVHALAPLQYWNERNPADVRNGAIIDPYNKAEVQYATPLFAFNVATLLSQGRAADLVKPGVRATASGRAPASSRGVSTAASGRSSCTRCSCAAFTPSPPGPGKPARPSR